MSSLSAQSYSTRASKHSHPLVRRLLTIAEAKKTNIVISADVTTTKELLELADGKQGEKNREQFSYMNFYLFYFIHSSIQKNIY